MLKLVNFHKNDFINLGKYFLNSFLVRVYFIFQFTVRLSILFYSIYNKNIAIVDFIPLLILGIFFDLLFLFYFLPILLIFKTIFHKAFNETILRFVYFIFAFFLFYSLIFGSVSEIMFWDEFGSRLNFIAVDYLVYTHELIGMLKEEMPLKTILLFLGVISLFCCFLSRNVILARLNSYSFGSEIKLFFVSSFLGFVCYFFISTEKINLSSNRYFNEAYKNGTYQLFSAFYNNYIDYEIFYTKIDEDKALQILRDEVAEENSEFLNDRDITRNIKNHHKGKKYNVIFVIVESLSADYLGVFGNKDNLTPNIDIIANEGMLFTNFYATGTRTVRGVEASILSVPPTPGSSIVRRMEIDNMFNIGSILKENGYKTNFIYPGNAYFDNLKNFFSSNGYSVIDSSDFSKEETTFSTAWGFCDEDLYKKTIKTCDKIYEEGKSFFSVVLTTSNHRPYTFPEGKVDLEVGSRKSAVKYTDYSIRKLIEESRKKEWFNDTIFVIMADHCSSSAGKMNLPIEKYHIPLIIYAPNIIKSEKIHTLSSQIDFAPTILDLLGISYESKFFGKSIFNMKEVDGRAFIGTYQLLGYVEGDYLSVLAPTKNPELCDIKNNAIVLIDNEENRKVVDRGISYYQIAYKFYKEKKMKDFPERNNKKK